MLTKLANTDLINEIVMITKRKLKYGKNLKIEEKRFEEEINKIDVIVVKEKIENDIILNLNKIFENSEINLNSVLNEEVNNYFNNKDAKWDSKKRIIDYISNVLLKFKIRK